jgi:hypothetical protein
MFSNLFPKIVPFISQFGKNTKRIVKFPLQQWLRERATVLRYMCITCQSQSCHGYLIFIFTVFVLNTSVPKMKSVKGARL